MSDRESSKAVIFIKDFLKFYEEVFAENPLKTAQGIVAAVLHYNDAKLLAEASENLGDAMKGIGNLKIVESFAEREGGNMKK